MGHLLFLNTFIHYLYIYYFYLKMVVKFGNFGHEKSWKSHEILMQASCGNPVKDFVAGVYVKVYGRGER